MAFNFFILPSVCKHKQFFSSVLLIVWCLRTAQGRRSLETYLQCRTSSPRALKNQKLCFCLPGPLAQLRPLAAKTPSCRLTFPFWSLPVHEFSCYFLIGIGLFYECGGNSIYFTNAKSISVCIKPNNGGKWLQNAFLVQTCVCILNMPVCMYRNNENTLMCIYVVFLVGYFTEGLGPHGPCFPLKENWITVRIDRNCMLVSTVILRV